MKKVIMTDLAITKAQLALTAAVCLVLGIFMTAAMDTPLVIGAPLAIFLPYTLSLRLWANDDQNGWGVFRLAMPQARRSLIIGRYLETLSAMCVSFLLGSLVSWTYGLVITPALPSGSDLDSVFTIASPTALGIFVCAVSALIAGISVALSTPLFAAIGAKGAAAFVPMLTMFALAFLIGGGSSFAASSGFGDRLRAVLPAALATPSGLLLFLLGAFALLTLVLLALSCAIAVKLYERREF